jgi:hypothetical protein
MFFCMVLLSLSSRTLGGFVSFMLISRCFYMKQRITEDLKDALSLWPNDVPTIMFYNIIDLLQMKIFFSSLISNYGSAFYFCLYNLFVSIFRVQWKMCTHSSTCRPWTGSLHYAGLGGSSILCVVRR